MRLSDELRRAIEPPRISIFGEYGFDTKEGPWKPPAIVAPALIEEAERLLPALVTDLAAAPHRAVMEWLARLGMAVASNLSPAEAMGKIEAIAGDLAADYPAAVFTDETRRKAMRAFKWFPSYSELAELLDPEKEKLLRIQRHLEAVIKAGKPKDAAPTRAEMIRAAIHRPRAEKPEETRGPILTEPPSQVQIDEWAKALGVMPDAIRKPA